MMISQSDLLEFTGDFFSDAKMAPGSSPFSLVPNMPIASVEELQTSMRIFAESAEAVDHEIFLTHVINTLCTLKNRRTKEFLRFYPFGLSDAFRKVMYRFQLFFLLQSHDLVAVDEVAVDEVAVDEAVEEDVAAEEDVVYKYMMKCSFFQIGTVVELTEREERELSNDDGYSSDPGAAISEPGLKPSDPITDKRLKKVRMALYAHLGNSGKLCDGKVYEAHWFWLASLQGYERFIPDRTNSGYRRCMNESTTMTEFSTDSNDDKIPVCEYCLQLDGAFGFLSSSKFKKFKGNSNNVEEYPYTVKTSWKRMNEFDCLKNPDWSAEYALRRLGWHTDSKASRWLPPSHYKMQLTMGNHPADAVLYPSPLSDLDGQPPLKKQKINERNSPAAPDKQLNEYPDLFWSGSYPDNQLNEGAGLFWSCSEPRLTLDTDADALFEFEP